MMTTLQLKALLEKLGDRPGGSADSGAALFKAAFAGNTTKVLEIINDHPEAVKFQNIEKQTPLQAAVHHGHLDTVTALLRGKAPLDHKDVDGDTALNYAVLGDKPEIVKCLLQAGSDINAANNKDFTPLHQSIVKGHQTCADVLLTYDQQKCDVNYKDKDSNSPLLLAITKNRKQIIRWLINNPETDLRQMNKKGFNSLHHAALCGNALAVVGILEVLPNMINDVTGNGFTALHIAAQNGLSVITLLLVKQDGCNKELKTNNGQTALHLAVDNAHKKCIEALVNSGANVNAQNSDGDTSLHVVMKASIKDIMRVTPLEKLLELVQQLGDKGVSSAKKYNLVAITVYLIKHGADIYIKNKTGSNVLDVCPNPRVENLLKDLYQRKESNGQ